MPDLATTPRQRTDRGRPPARIAGADDAVVDAGPRRTGAEDESADEAFETDPDATVQVSDTPRLDALLGDQR